MPRCPQCNKNLLEIVARCPSCQADLSLLMDYVSHLQGGLDRAENLTRDGKLDQAVWAYLEVLEVDPDNPSARRQVGRVATAVRQFDVTAPGRRWALGLNPFPGSFGLTWLRAGFFLLVLFGVFSLGYVLGTYYDPTSQGESPPKIIKPDKPPATIGLPRK